MYLALPSTASNLEQIRAGASTECNTDRTVRGSERSSPHALFFSNSVLTANLSFVRRFPKEHEMARKFTVFKGLAEATLT
jgi:hypothetical protein